MQDLKDVTNNVHYENYRSRKLAAVTCNGMDNNKTKGQLTKYVFVWKAKSFNPNISAAKRPVRKQQVAFWGDVCLDVSHQLW